MSGIAAGALLISMAHKKLTLPEKECVSCHRPFAWRKKWARDWDQVNIAPTAAAPPVRPRHDKPGFALRAMR